MEVVSRNRCFDGVQMVCTHRTRACGVDMTFAVCLPPEDGPVPVLWYLSGLTCTHESSMVNGGPQQHAAAHGLAIVFPDTSPRGEGVANDDACDLGQGAGFHVNARCEPWAAHHRMYDYVLTELRDLVLEALPLGDVHGIAGHAMGGHGALTLALRNPDKFDSLSAFAPIANPTRSDRGRKQLSAYLGDDESTWACYDFYLLLEERGWKDAILIDQGAGDQFLDLLRPEALASALARRREAGVLRMQPGYDHSDYFVSTFAGEHVAWHAERLHRLHS